MDYGLHLLTFKIFQSQNFFETYHLTLEYLVNFIEYVKFGYSPENPYHNIHHVIDSMQGMQFILTNGDVKKHFKKHDIYAAYIACLIHDYEHPGYSNQFVVRTKHPLAIRYSDINVLENHHLAAGFQILFNYEKSNLIENMPYEIQREVRTLIIDSVLNTDISKHFSLLTELKTKLGNNFPTDSLEDRKLIMSVSLRIASSFKVVRDRLVFFKWMDFTFDEFNKQG